MAALRFRAVPDDLAVKLEPLTRFTDRPYALLTPGQRELKVETIYGESLFKGKRDVEAALVKLKDYQCYVSWGLERFKHTTGATSWTLSTWRGRETRMKHEASGTTITSLRGTLEDSADPFSDLHATLTWLREFSVTPGSISSMAWSLFRASLTDPTYVDTDPEVTTPAFFGPRQQIDEPGTFTDVESRDIVAAYPTAMAARPFATALREVGRTTTLDPDVPGIAEATIYVPAFTYAPLPVRIAPEFIQFQTGYLAGSWAWCELAEAQRLGCEVNVTRSFAPKRTEHLFFNWWQMAQTGRDLPGYAATLAKAIANSLWGQAAMRGDGRAEVRWVADNGRDAFEVELPERFLPHRTMLNLAVETTARVRVQTLRAMNEIGTVLHVDTDGVLVPRNAPVLSNAGTGYGQFKTAKVMTKVEIKAPQFYRWWDSDNHLHYCASGMSEGAAAVTFERHRTGATKIAFLASPDVVLPQGSSDDDPRQWMAEAGRIR